MQKERLDVTNNAHLHCSFSWQVLPPI